MSCKHERLNQQGSERQEPTSGEEEGPAEPLSGSNLLNLLLHLLVIQHTLSCIHASTPGRAGTETGTGDGDRDRAGVRHRSPAETHSVRFRFPRKEKSPFWLPGETCEFPQVGGDSPKAAVAIATRRKLASSDFMDFCLQRGVASWQFGVTACHTGIVFLCFVSLNVKAAEFTVATAEEEETAWTPGIWRSSRPPRFWRGDLDRRCISVFSVQPTNLLTSTSQNRLPACGFVDLSSIWGATVWADGPVETSVWPDLLFQQTDHLWNGCRNGSLTAKRSQRCNVSAVILVL